MYNELRTQLAYLKNNEICLTHSTEGKRQEKNTRASRRLAEDQELLNWTDVVCKIK